MLAVQTASGMLYVPAEEIASIVPCYPDRVRVVLGDGRVGHRPGRVDSGPWSRLGEVWLNPRWLVRDGDFWRDPAGFGFPFEEFEEPVFEERSDLIAVESRGRLKWAWRRDSGESPCELKPLDFLALHPELCLVHKGCYLNMERVRESGAASAKGWLRLDNGQQVEVGTALIHRVAEFLGCESLFCIDLDADTKVSELREFPYDLRTAEPEVLLREFSEVRVFGEHLLWQLAIRPVDFGGHKAGLDRLLLEAAHRCGYAPGPRWIPKLFEDLVMERGIITMRQLGLVEQEPERRELGKRRPRVILLAPFNTEKPALQQASRAAARRAGVTLVLAGKRDQLVLEYLVRDLGCEPVQLLVWSLGPVFARRFRERLLKLGVESGPLVWLKELSELGPALKSLPKSPPIRVRRGFERVALESLQGLVFVAPEEIAAWSPTRPSRWRVVLADGRVFHHPGPVPPGPWQRCGEHWVIPQHLKAEGDGWLAPDGFLVQGTRPAAVPLRGPDEDPIVWLENRDGWGIWHLVDGSERASGLNFGAAAQAHPGLSAITDLYINHNRIRATEVANRRWQLRLDDGSTVWVPFGRKRHDLARVLGLEWFGELAPDRQGLRHLALRDYPYEIARAREERLRADFASALHLMANVVWQVASGRYRYGDGFMAFFYYPLMATLERAGFDSADKDKFYIQFAAMMTRMVQVYRLFTYREFGFKDPSPELRVIGDRQPGRILLVEKGERLAEYARRLQAEFGFSLLICKGMPSLLASEYFVQELRQHFQGEVEVFFYGDFDEVAWDMGPTFIRHLKFYGVTCKRLERLVLASCFSAEELELHSRVISTPSRESHGRVQRWIGEGGGIAGEARGIHGNWLQPFDRVRARLLELLA